MGTHKLKLMHSEIIKPKVPYNFDYSVYNPSHYPAPVVKYEKGKLWFSFRFENKLLGIKLINLGQTNQPAIKIQIYYKNKLNREYMKKLLEELNYKFQFDKDYSGFYKKFEKDKLVGRVIRKFKGMQNFCIDGLYEYLMIAILLQNANIKRTVQMTNSMLENYGGKIEFDGINLYSIWQPRKLFKVQERTLRKLRVGYRAKSFIRATKDYMHLNELEMRKLDNSDLRKKLLKVYGVGPASVDYIMNGVFHREVLNAILPWEAKIYSKLLKLNTNSPKKIMKYIEEHYGEHKSNVVHHLFMDISWKHKNKRIDWLEKLLLYNN